jgi:hypothetical protein
LHNVEVKQIALAYLNLVSVHLIILQSLVNKKMMQLQLHCKSIAGLQRTVSDDETTS